MDKRDQFGLDEGGQFELDERGQDGLDFPLMDRIGKRRWTEFIDTILEEYKKKMYLHLK